MTFHFLFRETQYELPTIHTQFSFSEVYIGDVEHSTLLTIPQNNIKLYFVFENLYPDNSYALIIQSLEIIQEYTIVFFLNNFYSVF